MAIYSTFFLAKPHQLLDAFPGWKPPLPAPVRREFRNPFTKQTVVIETREPEWHQEENRIESRQYGAVAIQGSYKNYLEGRLPQFLRESRHWAAKGLTNIEIEPLLGAIGVNRKLESPIYAPPSSGAVLRGFPPDFISTLIGINPGQIAQQWAAEMSSPQHTESVTGNKVSDGWTTGEASQILTPIVSLARQASSDERMYLLIEA